MKSDSVFILGLGSWGTALGQHLTAKGYEVLGWSIDGDIVSGINSSHKNPRYLPEATLSPKLKATTDLAAARDANIIVVALPSSALKVVCESLNISDGTTLVSATKGLESSTLLTPTKFIEKTLPGRFSVGVLSGPSFARDIVAHRPSGVVAASSDEQVAHKIAEIFNSDWMRVYTSTDVIGVELGGTVKNVIALAAGVSDGLELGDSARAGLITRGLAEIMRLVVAMGGKAQTLAGLSGLGDLAMTATSSLSRNRTVGYRLGKGESIEAIRSSLDSVAEAIESTPLVARLARNMKVDMPITFQVEDLLAGKVSVKEMVRNLLSRPTKKEFD